jgi:hypothetical protein
MNHYTRFYRKLPHHCFGVTVRWWDHVFNTTPPKKVSPSTRIVQFYFSGKKQALALILFAALATSCTHYYYGPNTSNIPLLKEKNDGKLNFNWYVTDEASGIEVQSAYAVGKHTGLMVNILSASEGGDFLGWRRFEDKVTGSGTYIEAAAGYFSSLPPTDWLFETYAGIGTGAIKNTYEYAETSKVGITKLFIQPSFGWSTKHLEIGLSARLAFVWLNVKNSSVTLSKNSGDYFDIDYIRKNRSGLLIEPGIMIRSGPKGIKFMLNYTGSYNNNLAWKQEEGSFSLGVCIPFKIDPGR